MVHICEVCVVREVCVVCEVCVVREVCVHVRSVYMYLRCVRCVHVVHECSADSMQPCDTASTGDAHSPTLGGLDVAPVSSGVCGPLCLSESSAYIRRRI